MNNESIFSQLNRLLKKIPVLRGLISTFELRQQKIKLFDSYSEGMRGIRQGLFKTIIFDDAGCRYVLNDGRVYLFDPAKSAGWLYSIPFTGTFERKETDFLRTLIQPGWICVDVGGCFGWYTVLLSRLVGNLGRVYVFEPIPDNALCLEANLGLNRCHNVVLNNYALSDSCQESIEIYVPKDGVSGSLEAHASKKNCEIINIKTSTLDKFAESTTFARLDFIKADIEGAEFLMLKGCREVLLKFKPILMLEVQLSSTRLFNYTPNDLFQFLRGIGYEVFFVSGDSQLIPFGQQQNMDKLPDYNFIFKPK